MLHDGNSAGRLVYNDDNNECISIMLYINYMNDIYAR
jgi:hypothetical protein